MSTNRGTVISSLDQSLRHLRIVSIHLLRAVQTGPGALSPYSTSISDISSSPGQLLVHLGKIHSYAFPVYYSAMSRCMAGA